MAEDFIRYQRWDNGELVEDYTVPKPIDQFHEETLRERAEAALATNKAFIDLPSPTNAQAVAEVKALARQVNALIRLTLRLLGDVTDTE